MSKPKYPRISLRIDRATYEALPSVLRPGETVSKLVQPLVRKEVASRRVSDNPGRKAQ